MFRKMIPLALAAAFAVPNFVPVDSPIISTPIVEAAKVKSDIPKGKVKQLKIGEVTVYKFGDVKLHAYNTKDSMADEFYALESKSGVVLLESGAFKNNVSEFNNYLKSLKKPLVAMLLSYHPNGYSTYGENISVYATEGAFDSWAEGGGVYALTQNFAKSFGAGVATDLPKTAVIVDVSEVVTLADIDFKILSTPDAEGNYGVEIPALNAVYRHMLGADVHNILPSIEYIDAEIADLENDQRKGYTLILTSHHTPEGQAAVAQKLEYLKRVRQIFFISTGAQDFIAAVKKEFPDYQGENYLEMTAAALFAKDAANE